MVRAARKTRRGASGHLEAETPPSRVFGERRSCVELSWRPFVGLVHIYRQSRPPLNTITNPPPRGNLAFHPPWFGVYLGRSSHRGAGRQTGG
jgi:hypothetical protein